MDMINNDRVKPTEASFGAGKTIRIFFCIVVLATLLAACGSDGRIGDGPSEGSVASEGAADTQVNAKTITLTWSPVPDADIAGYKVYYNSGTATFPVGVFGANEGTSPVDVGEATTATLTGLADDEIYYLTVTAYTESGLQSSYSNVVSSN
jgi:hypothetical protein